MKKTDQKKKKRGFTFIELLVVVVLIGVLSAIGVVSYVGTSQKSRDTKRKADLELIRGALELYKAEEGTYPSGDCLAVGEIGQYLSGGEVPSDPKTDWEPYACASSDGSTYCLSACLENDPAVGSCTELSDCTTGNSYKTTNP